MTEPGRITFLERVKIQAEVLVPLIKAFEKEIGSQRARAIARDALQSLIRARYAAVREKSQGDPIQLVSGGLAPFAEDALEYQMVDQSSEVFDFDVTRCAYAEFYKALGEPELGFLFVCDLDNAIADGLGSDLEFRRSQTIMQGGRHCDFRFRRRSES